MKFSATALGLLAALAATVACEAAPGPASSAGKKPHVLLIIADDMGYGNFGPHAGKCQSGTTKDEVLTPNLDQLVREGLLLERHYAYSYCSPSRASLQSGRLPVHVVTTNDDPMVFNPADPVSGFSGIPRKMTGIAEKLKGAGYKTHMTGKWDAGMATPDHTPTGRGYDSYFGYLHHANDYYTEKLGASSTLIADACEQRGQHFVDLWHNDGPAVGRNGTRYEEDMFLDHSLGVIAAHDASEPLFLVHSFHLIHTPLQVPPEAEAAFAHIADDARRKYAAMLAYLDRHVGLLVGAMRRKGMWDDTLVVFTSDNGGPTYAMLNPTPPGPGQSRQTVYGGANNAPLRGGKLSDWEGGIRVNAFVSGGFLPAAVRGQVLEEHMHIADWYATLCHLAGADPVDARAAEHGLPAVDSVNVWPMLSGEAVAPLHDELHISANTLIQGEWKLLTGSDLATFAPMFAKSLPVPFVPMDGVWPGYGVAAIANTLVRYKACFPACVYNIREDPFEEHDVAHRNATRTRALLARLAHLNKDNFNPDRGTADPASCDIFQNKYHGFYGPFIDIDGGVPAPERRKPLLRTELATPLLRSSLV